MSPPRILGSVAVAILATAGAGCSFLFVNGPPAEHRKMSFFGCTSSNTIPTLDAVFGTAALVDAVAAGAGSSTFGSSVGTRRAEAITFGAEALLLGASSAYGYQKTSECRKAEAELQRRAPVMPMGPPPSAPPPYDPWLGRPIASPVPAAPAGPGPSVWDSPGPGK
jgi:hypothetical protein